jgi:uncharacterized protein
MKQKKPNKLINESGPYLLQHAYNPVEWYAWNDDALSKAKKENKPLIISIGYAACHWCHVMEHESFEDEEVAKLMNENFVSIKVDREERPDIDQVYMDAAYLITGRGGWPLNVVALPDGRPIFAGTYFPKEQWKQVLKYFRDNYSKETETIEKEADKLTQALRTVYIPGLNEKENLFSREEIDNAFQKIINIIDFEEGGTKGAPKFPLPGIFESLLQFNYHTENENALQAVELTLDKIATGGIYDHIGGGFARYSTDNVWKVPHFEKMLYDNAQLVSLYSNVFKVTKKNLYKEVIYQTLEFVERELSDSSGGFYSSLDADSEGVEGKYYLWNEKEIEKLLGNDSKFFCEYFNVIEKGNWEDGNILFINSDKKDILKKYNLDEKSFDEKIQKSKRILLNERLKRIKPGLDDKILTSWNALMIKAFSDAYSAFGEQRFLQRAVTCGDFIKNKMMNEDGKLFRNYKNNKSTINGFLDDYSFTIEAFISLYQITFDEKWIYDAKILADYTIKHFHHSESGLFFYKSDQDEPLIARKMELSDNVIPSSNASLATALIKLSKYFYSENYEATAEKMILTMKQSAQQNPAFHFQWLITSATKAYPLHEVVMTGEDIHELKSKFLERYLPNIILAGSAVESSLGLLENRIVQGKTMIYICQNKACNLPTENFETAVSQISKD